MERDAVCVCVCVCVCDTLMLSLYVYVHTSMYLTESEHVSKNLVELQFKWLLFKKKYI